MNNLMVLESSTSHSPFPPHTHLISYHIMSCHGLYNMTTDMTTGASVYMPRDDVAAFIGHALQVDDWSRMGVAIGVKKKLSP
jgi:hypothetical protein